MNDINISQVEESQVEQLQQYVMGFRRDLFPMLDNRVWPRDIAHFKEVYIDHHHGVFLQARRSDGQLIGVVGMLPYDHRFPYLDYSKCNTVEVARLFVEPAYRRLGLGCLLVQELFKRALERNIEMMYLHTHPFLAGAFEFWKCQGFEHVYTSVDNGQTTWHMQRAVGI